MPIYIKQLLDSIRVQIKKLPVCMRHAGEFNDASQSGKQGFVTGIVVNVQMSLPSA
jgi:hypothetical protein